MEIKQVKFGQPVHLVGKQFSSINLLSEHKEQYSMVFEAGLLTIIDMTAPEKSHNRNVALVPLANIAYMISGTKAEKKEVKPEKTKKA